MFKHPRLVHPFLVCSTFILRFISLYPHKHTHAHTYTSTCRYSCRFRRLNIFMFLRIMYRNQAIQNCQPQTYPYTNPPTYPPSIIQRKREFRLFGSAFWFHICSRISFSDSLLYQTVFLFCLSSFTYRLRIYLNETKKINIKISYKKTNFYKVPGKLPRLENRISVYVKFW